MSARSGHYLKILKSSTRSSTPSPQASMDTLTLKPLSHYLFSAVLARKHRESTPSVAISTFSSSVTQEQQNPKFSNTSRRQLTVPSLPPVRAPQQWVLLHRW